MCDETQKILIHFTFLSNSVRCMILVQLFLRKGLINMLYALLGDLHSNIEDTKAVLNHIQQTANDAEIIGLGDLYECIVSKKGTVCD